MTPKQKKRMRIVLLVLAGLSVTSLLALNAFRSNLMYFLTPAEIVAGGYPDEGMYRLGGMVVEGSVRRLENGITVEFDLTDYQQTVTVRYTGILPDLFREGQGIIAHGKIDGQLFSAEEVLAKHDESYMAPELAEAMKNVDMNKTSSTNSISEETL
ncbi:MAG: cytochrome c maturation protein CcmE [Proteobacteria bacterium]|jgi:cytochrome c-type biogenesis protein CcmE|nr:cytochrome c maturation protein CcmE [Pseudomonadota bacterium]